MALDFQFLHLLIVFVPGSVAAWLAWRATRRPWLPLLALAPIAAPVLLLPVFVLIHLVGTAFGGPDSGNAGWLGWFVVASPGLVAAFAAYRATLHIENDIKHERTQPAKGGRR